MNDHEKRLRLRALLTAAKGSLAPGVSDAMFARLAADCGYAAVHLSGNAIHKNFCLVDENLLSAAEIAARAAQINEAVEIPLIVDGGPADKPNKLLTRAVREFERAGAAAIRLEDSSAGSEKNSALPKAQMIDRIKNALDARRDSALVIIARCDTRPTEPLDKVLERITAYGEAGADAVGVQLTDVAEFRQTGSTIRSPLVSMWPKTLMSASEFLEIGFKIALMPSSVPLAALSAAREMLLELRETATDRNYFKRQKEFPATESWYKNLGRR
ncbi:MAG TPA: isocitrate lyase/PEP mutase family protein [Candidatus Binatia bacterium]|jgi:2-methylisocitrate lyase-like PEP mutase family enzyme